MSKYTLLEKEVAAIIAEMLDAQTYIDTNRDIQAIWNIAKAVTKEVENTERERIIKVLESIRVGDEWIGRNYAIALINGEEQ